MHAVQQFYTLEDNEIKETIQHRICMRIERCLIQKTSSEYDEKKTLLKIELTEAAEDELTNLGYELTSVKSIELS